MSLPTILSGSLYQGGSARAFLNDSTADGFLGDAAKAGHDVRYLNYLKTNCPMAILCMSTSSYAEGLVWHQVIKEYAELFRMGVLRVTPIAFHPALDQDAFLSVANHIIPGLKRTRFEEDFHAQEKFWESLMVVPDARPQLHFQHYAYSHHPSDFDSDCRYVGPIWQNKKAAVLDETKCAIKQLAKLVNRLRDIGIYDNTALLFISDHGQSKYFYGDIKLTPDEMSYYPGEEGNYQATVMFKPMSTRGPLKSSQAPVSLLDIRKTICGLLSACEPRGEGIDLLALEDGMSRERTLMQFRSWSKPRQDDGSYAPNSYKFVKFSGGIEALKEVLFDPPSYKTSTPIDFTSGGNSRMYTFSGWATQQDKGTFNDARSGRPAILELPITPKPVDDLSLSASISAFVGPLAIDVVANGQKVAVWKLPNKQAETLSARIPFELIKSGGALRLELIPDKVATMNEIDGRDDYREIGFMVREMVVSPVSSGSTSSQ